MRAVCAWCGADLGTRPGPEDKITHSVCRPCAARELAKIGLVVVRDGHGAARVAAISAAGQPDGTHYGARPCGCALPSRTEAAELLQEVTP